MVAGYAFEMGPPAVNRILSNVPMGFKYEI